MRRSRRNGQLRRVSSMARGSHSTIRVSSASCDASAITCPCVSQTNDPPQNSMPFSAGPSYPTRFTDATYTPLAMACDRWMVRQESCCALPNSAFSGRVPADGGGVEQNLRAAQSCEAGGFGIPLVPTDERGNPRETRIETAEAQIAWSEVIFLEVQRVVGDVHLAIESKQRSIGVDHECGVVVYTGRAPFEHRTHDHDSQLARQTREALAGGAGNRLRQIRQVGAFLPAEVLRAEKFLHADDLRAFAGGLAGCAFPAFARFSLRSRPQAIWTRPTRNFVIGTTPFCTTPL